MRKLKTVLGVVLVVVILVTAVIIGSKEKGQPVGNNQPVPVDETRTEPIVTELKKPQKDNIFIFTVDNLECGVGKVGASARVVAQGQFCLLTMSVKNDSDGRYRLNDLGQYLAGVSTNESKEGEPTPQPVKYHPDLLATQYINDAWREMAPKEQMDIVLVFDIPKSVKVTSVELRDDPESAGILVNIPEPNEQN